MLLLTLTMIERKKLKKGDRCGVKVILLTVRREYYKLVLMVVLKLQLIEALVSVN